MFNFDEKTIVFIIFHILWHIQALSLPDWLGHCIVNATYAYRIFILQPCYYRRFVGRKPSSKTERIEYKLLSPTYEVLTTTQPSHLHNLITFQSPRSTFPSSLVTLARPSTSSSLRITDRSFQYASPRLWNQLPASLHQPRTNLSNSDSPSSLKLWVALPPLVPSTHHSHHPSTLHYFIPGVKPSFSAKSFPP